MANSVTARAPAWADGISVTGAEMRAAVLGSVWASAGMINGLRPTQLPTPAMQIRVPVGRCVVSDGAGGMLVVELLTQTDLDIAASSPTQARIDSLIAEFVDNGASSLYRFRIITGTPAGSPSAPSLPPADQPTAKTLRLANIAVAANATTIVNANITVQASMAISNAFNGLTTIANTAARPTEIAAGTMRMRTDDGVIDVVGPNGSTWYSIPLSGLGPTWTSYTPAMTATTTNPTLGTGSSVLGAWTRSGKTVHARAYIKCGTSGTATGSGTYRVSLPVTARTLSVGGHFGVGEVYDASADNIIDAFVRSNSGTGFSVVEFIQDGTLWSSSSLGIQVNDAFGFSITYEAAT